MMFSSTITSNQNIYYTRGITPKRVTSGASHLRDFAPGLHSFEETVVGDTVFDLKLPGETNLQPSAPSNVFHDCANWSITSHHLHIK